LADQPSVFPKTPYSGVSESILVEEFESGGHDEQTEDNSVSFEENFAIEGTVFGCS
jgi:hypothetical protein